MSNLLRSTLDKQVESARDLSFDLLEIYDTMLGRCQLLIAFRALCTGKQFASEYRAVLLAQAPRSIACLTESHRTKDKAICMKVSASVKRRCPKCRRHQAQAACHDHL